VSRPICPTCFGVVRKDGATEMVCDSDVAHSEMHLRLRSAVALLLSFVPLHAQQQPGAPSRLRAVAYVESVEGCQANAEDVRVDIKMRLRLENVGANSLIVGRQWYFGGYRMVTPDIDLSGKRAWTSLHYVFTVKPHRAKIDHKLNAAFQRLNPGDSMDTPVVALVVLTRPDPPITLSMQISAGVSEFWGWAEKDFQKAQRKWAAYGELWENGIDTEPFNATLEKAPLKDCPGRK